MRRRSDWRTLNGAATSYVTIRLSSVEGRCGRSFYCTLHRMDRPSSMRQIWYTENQIIIIFTVKIRIIGWRYWTFVVISQECFCKPPTLEPDKQRWSPPNKTRTKKTKSIGTYPNRTIRDPILWLDSLNTKFRQKKFLNGRAYTFSMPPYLHVLRKPVFFSIWKVLIGHPTWLISQMGKITNHGFWVFQHAA